MTFHMYARFGRSQAYQCIVMLIPSDTYWTYNLAVDMICSIVKIEFPLQLHEFRWKRRWFIALCLCITIPRNTFRTHNNQNRQGKETSKRSRVLWCSASITCWLQKDFIMISISQQTQHNINPNCSPVLRKVHWKNPKLYCCVRSEKRAFLHSTCSPEPQICIICLYFEQTEY